MNQIASLEERVSLMESNIKNVAHMVNKHADSINGIDNKIDRVLQLLCRVDDDDDNYDDEYACKEQVCIITTPRREQAAVKPTKSIKPVVKPIQRTIVTRMCGAETQKGSPCTKKAQEGSCYCGIHLRSQAIQAQNQVKKDVRHYCQGVNKKGKPCSKLAQEGSNTCHWH